MRKIIILRWFIYISGNRAAGRITNFKKPSYGRFVKRPYIHYLSSLTGMCKQKFKLLKNQSIILGNQSAKRIHTFSANCSRALRETPLHGYLIFNFHIIKLEIIFTLICRKPLYAVKHIVRTVGAIHESPTCKKLKFQGFFRLLDCLLFNFSLCNAGALREKFLLSFFQKAPTGSFLIPRSYRSTFCIFCRCRKDTDHFCRPFYP